MSTPGVQGTLFPAVAGLVLTEYGADGEPLQRSSPTDDAGAFAFGAPLRGTRVEAIYSYGSTRVDRQWSARVSAGQTVLDVGPLSTLYDQFRSAGLPRLEAMRTMDTLLGDACGDAAARAGRLSAATARPLPADQGPWLSQAVHAYVEALNGVGLGPGLQRAWATAVLEHRALLGRMCGLASDVYSTTWPERVGAATAAAGAAGQRLDLASLERQRPVVVDQVLALMGRRIVAMEHPSALRAPGVASAMRADDGSDLALRLAVARYSRDARPGAVALTGEASGTSAGSELGPGGEIVQTLRASSLANGSTPAFLRVRNAADGERRVTLNVNGRPIFDREGLLGEVLAMPRLRRNEPLQQVAWRYVTLWTDHNYPVSGGRFLHQPELFMRSIGAGYCDDMSMALSQIWADLGMPSRIWELQGHVVPEVMVQGNWELYDPDIGVYYFNRQARVAGAEELFADPTLVSDPSSPLFELGHSAYTSNVVQLYATKDDNVLDSWFGMGDLELQTNVFTLPSGSHLTVVGDPMSLMRTVDSATTLRGLAVRLWLPPGYVGEIELPLLLAEVTGSGRVELLGEALDVTRSGIASRIDSHYLSSPDRGIARLKVLEVGAGGLNVYMPINPAYALPDRSLTVQVRGADLSGLSFENAVTAR